MKIKVLIVYQFATFGGVERVLINRAEAFKNYKKNYKLYVYFYEDYGAKESLKQYIKCQNLEDYIEIVDSIDLKYYDRIISIDTPKILENKDIDLSKVYIETHTFEKRWRLYLDKYLTKVKKVIVPSQVFLNQLAKEYPKIKMKNVEILNDFVPMTAKTNNVVQLPNWNRKTIFYFGRIDYNKNLKEIIESLKFNDYQLLLIGSIDKSYELDDFIEFNDLIGRVLILPPIGFDKVNLLLNSMKKNESVFVSASKGETFSLSAAESISADIPCILSNIEAHKSLVKNDDRFLYQLGDIKSLNKKLKDAFKHYNDYQKIISNYKNDFSSKKFIEEWDNIFG